MYTRNFFPDENKISTPENYDGNAFSEPQGQEEMRISPKPTLIAETKISPRENPVFTPEADESHDTEASARPEKENSGTLSSVFKRLPFSNLFPAKLGGIFKGGGFKIGGEELLIIALSLFLLFSKDGDKECALMLLGLLFIG